VVTIDRLREVIDCISINLVVFENKLNDFRIIKTKILLIKQFLGERLKLKGFLIKIGHSYSHTP
jgi:hypothetical protein